MSSQVRLSSADRFAPCTAAAHRSLPRAASAACIALLTLSASLAASPVRAADLTVDIQTVDSAEGQVMVAVFDQADQFLKQPLAGISRSATGRDAQGRIRLVFTNLPAGRYALSAVHDRNGNGKLDSNLMGIPSEPYGFSNGARGSFGPPKFDDALVTLDAAGGQIEITVK